MGAQNTHAPMQEHAEHEADEKGAPEARTPSSVYAPPHLSITGAGAADGPPLTRDNLMLLQRAVGNRAVGRLLQRTKTSRASGESGRGDVGVPVQAESAGAETPSVGPAVRDQLRSSKGGGQPLPDRGLFESTLGHDFSGVSLHTDSTADSLSRSLNARAFTTGRDIYFRQGEYQPGTEGGRELLSHELTHVVQQASGPVPGTPVGGGVSLSDPSDSHEQAASQTAQAVSRKLADAHAGGAPSGLSQPAPPGTDGASVQRQEGAATDAKSAQDIIDKHTGMLGGLDEEALGAELASMLPGQTGLVFAVMERLPDSDSDDVAQEVVINLGGGLSAVDDALRVRFVWDMVYGTVTDSEEGAIAQIWDSFGERLPDVAAAYPGIWKVSVEESDQLNELPRIVSIRQGFESDVVGLAKNYLEQNKLEVMREREKLGIAPAVEGAEMETEPEYLENLKVIAGKVASLQNFLKELTRIQVGYDMEYGYMDAPIGYKVPASFDPGSKPMYGPTGEESPPIPSWEVVKEQHDRASAVVSGFANTYPAIYALIRDEKLQEVAAGGDLTQALAVVAESLSKVIEKIDESREKLDTEDIEYYDLVPIYTQLFQGAVQTSFQPSFKWSHPFFQMVGKDVLKDQEARDFWTSLGLGLVAAAALIAAPFTGGATLVILLGTGLGIGAGQAAAAWEKYDDLKTMSGAHVNDQLALISEGQVTAALVDAVISTAALFLDAFGARAATTGAKVAGRTAESIKAFEAGEQALKEQMSREARERAARGAAADAGMTVAGTGLAVAQHELFGDAEPEFYGSAQVAEVDLPQDYSDEVSEDTSEPVSRMVIQRQTGGGGGGGAPPVPATGAAAPPTIFTGSEFEAYVARAFKRGEFGEGLRMDFVIPGQYIGSGHGIDLIGIRVTDSGKLVVIQAEVKYVMPGSAYEPSLGQRRAGTQTGSGWTERAIDGFLNSNNRVARRNRERMRRALQKIYGVSYVTNDELRDFVRRKLLNARVIVVTPDYAILTKLHRQLGGLVRHGRRAASRTIRIP